MYMSKLEEYLMQVLKCGPAERWKRYKFTDKNMAKAPLK